MGSMTAPRAGQASASKRHSAKDSARLEFWSWFSRTIAPDGIDRLDDDGVVNEIGERLQCVHPDLSFELWGPDDGTVHFVISADGVVPLFEEVLALVRCAPAIDNWRVVAFRPRRPVNARIRAQDIELTRDEIWYRWEPIAGRLRLALFIENLTDENWDLMCAASHVLLDMALGEYDAATKIAALEHYPLTAETQGPALRPLRELAEEVDQFFGGAVH